jgi:hypothetical protein
MIRPNDKGGIMRRYLACILGLGLIAGCASIETIEKSDPVFEASTKKSMSDYADCVMLQWVQSANAGTRRLKTHAGTRILVPGMGGADEILDISDSDGVTRIALRERVPALSANVYKRTALDCR